MLGFDITAISLSICLIVLVKRDETTQFQKFIIYFLFKISGLVSTL